MVPDLEVFGIVVKFETVWFVNTLVFAVTLFLFAAGSFLRVSCYYVAEAGPVFYKISVLLIPLFFLIYVGAAFIRFQDEHWMAFRIGGIVILSVVNRWGYLYSPSALIACTSRGFPTTGSSIPFHGGYHEVRPHHRSINPNPTRFPGRQMSTLP